MNSLKENQQSDWKEQNELKAEDRCRRQTTCEGEGDKRGTEQKLEWQGAEQRHVEEKPPGLRVSAKVSVNVEGMHMKTYMERVPSMARE